MKVLEHGFPDQKRRGGFIGKMLGFGRVVMLSGEGKTKKVCCNSPVLE